MDCGLFDCEKLIGKNIKVILKNNFYYRGQLLDADSSFIKIKDKVGRVVFLSISEISTLEEVNV